MKLLSEAVALYLLLISSLARALSPNPDETQRVLPWPSWVWQRLSLLAVFPVAAAVFAASLPEFTWAGLGAAVVLALVAGYGIVATRWLRATRQARLPARLAAGASVAAG